MATKKQEKNVEVKAAPKTGAAPKSATVKQSAKAPSIKNDEAAVKVNATTSQDENLDIILKLENITKTFLGGKIVANDDVSLSFARNEVHAIVGENGSGKSTLMNIIFGLYKQDKGDIFINDKKVDMYQSGAAKKHRIGMVHQHFHLVDAFTVLENVILGQEELTRTKKEKLKIKGLKQELKEVKAQLRTLWKLDSMKIEHNSEHTVELSFEDQNLTLTHKKNDLEDELATEQNILNEMIADLKEKKANHILFKRNNKPIVNHLDDLMVIMDEIHQLESDVMVQRDLVMSIKEKINRVNHEIIILEQKNKKSKKRASQKLKETDTNFVAAVMKLVKLKHQVQIDIKKENNIISELKNEKARLSSKNKHHAKRLEQISDEIIERNVIIAEEMKAVELIAKYQDSAKNEDQKKAVELGKRQYQIEIDLQLLESKLTGSFGKIKFKESISRLKEIQLKYNINLDPYAKVGNLAVGQRQMVEILKVLWEEKEIIVFDEPTATLSVVEIEDLLKTIDALKAEGKTIIFISHKLKEVKALADRVSVLRKGTMMGTYINDDKLQPADIGELMVGKTIEINYPKRTVEKKPILKVENVSYRTRSDFKAVDDVSFEIYEGEIFGLAGIEGNGQEEIVKMITDLRKPTEGSISIAKNVKKKEAKHLIKERASIEAERVLERAELEKEKLTTKNLEKEIRDNTKRYIREAKMDALDKESKILTTETKKTAKLALKQIKHELKKDLLLIKKNEHVELKELHSHKKIKELNAQKKNIDKVSKVESKNIITEANKRIKAKDFDGLVWDIITDADQGPRLTGTQRREMQSHVPIDRLKHGVVPTMDLEFNAKITDFDTKFLNKYSKDKEAITKLNDERYEVIAKENESNLEIINAELEKVTQLIPEILSALVEVEIVLERAELEKEKLTTKNLKKEIRDNTKRYIREAKMDALDKESKILTTETKKTAKLTLKQIKNELKKDLLLIKKNEHVELKELHSHEKIKELNAQKKNIDKVAKVESKNIINEVNKRIKDNEAITQLISETQLKNVLKDLNVVKNNLDEASKIIKISIDNHDARKTSNLHKLLNPVYKFTQDIISGMKVDGAFNHQVEIRNLSGGNQQKFVVGREMFRDHRLFVAGHPTRGLDISAIDHIYKEMIKNAEGKATLLYSLEINELLAVCDRVAVMYHGKIIDIVDPKKVTLEQVSRMMIGEKG